VSERLLTAGELADYLGLTAGTILDRFERGDLPGFRLFGRQGGPVRFRLADVEAALESWRVNGPAGGASANQHHRRPNGVEYVAPTSTTEED
jgi:excisionase family DNA binding protein